MPSTVILGTARTPFGKMGGTLSSLDATDLGGHAISAALERSGVDPEQVQQVVFGQVLQAGQGQIPSRQAQIKGGIPKEVPSETINKVCASGMRSVGLADIAIRAGDAVLQVSGAHGGVDQADRADPRCAHLVDRLGGDLLGDAALDLGLAGRDLALARLQHLTHHDLLDLLGIHLRALQRGGDRRASEVGRVKARKGPSELAEGSAGCTKDDGLWHLLEPRFVGFVALQGLN